MSFRRVRDDRAPILFLHSADHANFNAQAKNVQNILAWWPDSAPPAVVLAFGEPDGRLLTRPNVTVIQVLPDRLWQIRVIALLQQRYSAVVLPHLHVWADWVAVMLRRYTGRVAPLITTVEGLGGTAPDPKIDEERYTKAAGHAAYCQPIDASVLKRRRQLHGLATRIVAISPFLGRMTELDYPGKVSVAPLGIDESIFQPSGRSKRSRVRVVSAAGVRSHKRPELFVELAARFPSADFIWHGDGDLRALMLETCRQRGLQNIFFPGAIPPDELAASFRSSDIFVLTSRNEGVPKVTQESAACGLPQVIFGFYEAPSVVDGHNGLLVWDDESMIRCVGGLIEDAVSREKMGHAGVQMAKDWSWQRVAPLWHSVICDVAAKGDRARW